jgi:hypothetical protein
MSGKVVSVIYDTNERPFTDPIETSERKRSSATESSAKKKKKQRTSEEDVFDISSNPFPASSGNLNAGSMPPIPAKPGKNPPPKKKQTATSVRSSNEMSSAFTNTMGAPSTNLFSETTSSSTPSRNQPSSLVKLIDFNVLPPKQPSQNLDLNAERTYDTGGKPRVKAEVVELSPDSLAALEEVNEFLDIEDNLLDEPEPSEDELMGMDSGLFNQYAIRLLASERFGLDEASLIRIQKLFRTYNRPQRDHLKRVLIRIFIGDKDVSSKPNNQFFQQFNIFLQKWGPTCPWTFTDNSATEKLFWLSSPPEVRDGLVLKFQTLKLCSAIAATVFVEAHVSVNNHGTQNLHVDVARLLKLVSTTFIDDIIGLLSAEPVGLGVCKDYLHAITLNQPQFVQCQMWKLPYFCDLMLNYLEKYPILLAELGCHESFRSRDHDFFTAPPSTGPYIGRHAMVIIGGRKAPDGEYLFLLQNWWDYRPFVEMSADYLMKNYGLAVWFENPNAITQLNPDVPKLAGNVSAVETLDGASEAISRPERVLFED